jgi:hypothetical protein
MRIMGKRGMVRSDCGDALRLRVLPAVAKRSERKRVTWCRVVYTVCSRTFGLCLLGGNLKTGKVVVGYARAVSGFDDVLL